MLNARRDHQRRNLMIQIAIPDEIANPQITTPKPMPIILDLSNLDFCSAAAGVGDGVTWVRLTACGPRAVQ